MKPESFTVGLALTVYSHIQGLPYTMQLMNAEHPSFHLKDLDTLSTCDHNYLLSKVFDTCV